MDVKDLQLWIKDPRNFERGRQLYEAFGDSSFLKSRFALGETEFTRQRLQEELEAIAKTFTEGRPVTRHSEIKIQKPDPESLPPNLQRKNVKKGQLFREAAVLHNQMFDAGSDTERKRLSDEKLGKLDEIRKIWGEIHSYRAPEAVNPAGKKQLPLKDFMQRYHNLPSYISKGNRALVKMKQKGEKEFRIKKKQDAIAEYEAELKDMQNTIEHGIILI